MIGHLQIFISLLLRAEHIISLRQPFIKLVILLSRCAIGNLVRVVLQSQVSHLLSKKPQIILFGEVHFLKGFLDLLIFLLNLPSQNIDTDLVILARKVLGQLLALAFETGLKDLAAFHYFFGKLLGLLVGLCFLLFLCHNITYFALYLSEQIIVLIASSLHLLPNLTSGLIPIFALLGLSLFLFCYPLN